MDTNVSDGAIRDYLLLVDPWDLKETDSDGKRGIINLLRKAKLYKTVVVKSRDDNREVEVEVWSYKSWRIGIENKEVFAVLRVQEGEDDDGLVWNNERIATHPEDDGS